MKRQSVHQLLRGVGIGLVALVALVAVQDRASACSCFCDSLCSTYGDCCSWCSGGIGSAATAQVKAQVKIIPAGQHGARIKVTGLQTMEMPAAFDCASALSNVAGVQKVSSVALVNRLTGKPVYTYFSEEASGQSFEELATDIGRGGPNTKWLGFHAQTGNGNLRLQP
ncbi:MAG: hypothetical protein ACJ76N_29375 [Thermoanaerobaculia bacterium]